MQMGHKTILVLWRIIKNEELNNYVFEAELVIDSVKDTRFPLKQWKPGAKAAFL